MKNKIKFLLLALALLILPACSNQENAENVDNVENTENVENVESTEDVENEKPVAYTTILSVSDFSSKIGGDKIEVVNLMEDVSDAHHWEPSPTDMANINQGDLLIINGAGFEFWVEDVAESLDGDVEIIDTSQGVDLLPAGDHGHDHGHDHDHEHDHDHDHDHNHDHDHSHDHGHDHHGHDHGEFDPHYWINPKAAAKQAENICQAFIGIDPENEEYYTDNYNKLVEELEKLDKEYNESLKDHANKGLIVPHKAFTYMTEEYDLVQIPIEGLLADGDPNPQRMAEIVSQAEEQGIQAVFYDPYQDPRASEQIANELGVGTLPLYTLESISKEDRENGEDYFSLMRKNLDSILKSFGE